MTAARPSGGPSSHRASTHHGGARQRTDCASTRTPTCRSQQAASAGQAVLPAGVRAALALLLGRDDCATTPNTGRVRSTPPSSRTPSSGSPTWTRQGIDVQVLSVPPTEYFYWLPERPRRCAPTGFSTSGSPRSSARWPDRFAAVANVPMDYPRWPSRCCEEAHRDFGFGGFEISADVLGSTSTTGASTRCGRRPSSST